MLVFIVIIKIIYYICFNLLISNTMNNTSNHSHNNLFFGILFLLIILFAIGSHGKNVMLLNVSQGLIIPLFIVFFFLKNKTLSMPLIAFFLFAFFSDTTSFFFDNYNVIKASSVLFFLGYICLIGVVINKFKFFETDRVVGLYLLTVLSINMYFLYTIYSLLKVAASDNFETLLFGTKSMSLMVLAFLALAIYLNKQTKSALLFLMAVSCLVFASVLNYIGVYYIYDWRFITLEKASYILGLYLLFKYIIQESKTSKEERYFTDTIFA